MPRDNLEITLVSDEFPTDNVRIVELHGRERISELFEYTLTVDVPAGSELSATDVAGATAAIVFTLNGEDRRHIFGMIAEVVDLLDSESADSRYRLRFVPEAWRLNMVKTQEITMASTLAELIHTKLGLVGLGDRCAFGLADPDPKREFIVQYEETDLAFLSRLTEHVGWSFYFDDTGEASRLVFTDEPGGFHRVAGAERVAYHRRGELEGIHGLELATRLIPAVYAVNDFNYMLPLVDVAGLHEVKDAYAGGVMEYGTHYDTPEQGAIFARVRAEEFACRAQVFKGEASVCTLTAGARVTIAGHPRLGDLEVLIIAAEHVAKRVDGSPSFVTKFEAIDAKVPYRPLRSTPRPRIAGVMSGIIEADPGVETEQAWIDDHGRYLVRMLFEASGPAERPASLPIRMSQPHSGPGYGVHFPLRPGTEVLVAFIGGDPDRPVIVGSVPNASTPTPVADKIATRHRIKTWSGVLVEIDDGG